MPKQEQKKINLQVRLNAIRPEKIDQKLNVVAVCPEQN